MPIFKTKPFRPRPQTSKSTTNSNQETTSHTTTQIGKHTETEALKYLQEQGLTLVAANYRCKFGEIDLIMLHEKPHKTYLVFVEVRFRANIQYGSPAATVSKQKQKKVVRCAQFFLKSKQWQNLYPCRFDVIAMTPNLDNTYRIKWIPSAFQTSGY